MTFSVEDTFLALRDVLKTMTVIKQAYNYIPDNITQFPAAYVGLAEASYDASFGRGTDTLRVAVTVVVGRLDVDKTQVELQKLMSGSGAGSIKAVLEQDSTLGGLISQIRVSSADNTRAIMFGEVSYLATDFNIEIAG